MTPLNLVQLVGLIVLMQMSCTLFVTSLAVALLGMTIAFCNWSLRCLDQFAFCTITSFLIVNPGMWTSLHISWELEGNKSSIPIWCLCLCTLTKITSYDRVKTLSWFWRSMWHNWALLIFVNWEIEFDIPWRLIRIMNTWLLIPSNNLCLSRVGFVLIGFVRLGSLLFNGGEVNEREGRDFH